MILADDNFSTIVAAIEEGRSIYSNMKAFIRYMISSNIGEVASIFLTAALGFPEGMISVQLLWVNLVTDGPPATALGFNKSEPDVMRRPPRRADDALIGRWASFRFLVIGAYVGVATVGILATWFTHTHFMGLDLSRDGHSAISLRELMNWDKCDTTTNMFHMPGQAPYKFSARPWTAVGPLGGPKRKPISGCDYFGDEGKMKASTLSLTVLVVIEMMNACNALSEDSSLLTVTPLSNPYLLMAISASVGVHLLILYVPQLSPYFDVVPLSMNEWILVLLFSFPVVIIDEMLKFVARNFLGETKTVVRGGAAGRGGGGGSGSARSSSNNGGAGGVGSDDEDEDEDVGTTTTTSTTGGSGKAAKKKAAGKKKTGGAAAAAAAATTGSAKKRGGGKSKQSE
jgi:Ca2+-transporting ATPase